MPLPPDLVKEYSARTPASRALYHRFVAALPGGETRSVTFYSPYPLVLERGQGAHVVDADGNEYLDVLNNYTALVHGHAAPPIVRAAAAAMAEGTVFPAPTRHQLELAEAIVMRFPAVELVRFTNSGTEASLLALRLARRATGRRGLVMFEGGYHGTAPEFVDDEPDTRRVPYNDLNAVRAAVNERTAAVFVEPFLGSGGVIPARDGFLAGIEAIAASAGALVVLDEVQSLRSHLPGVHGEQGLHPDLITLGKIIGGGFPVGAVGGRGDLMSLTAANRPGAMMHSGTFNGNSVTAAAGLASLRLLDASAIATLNRRAAFLAGRISEAGHRSDLNVAITRYGSIMQVHLKPGERSITAASLHLALLLEGVYAAPRGMLNLSTALTDADLERVASGYASAFQRLSLAPVASADRSALGRAVGAAMRKGQP